MFDREECVWECCLFSWESETIQILQAIVCVLIAWLPPLASPKNIDQEGIIYQMPDLENLRVFSFYGNILLAVNAEVWQVCSQSINGENLSCQLRRVEIFIVPVRLFPWLVEVEQSHFMVHADQITGFVKALEFWLWDMYSSQIPLVWLCWHNTNRIAFGGELHRHHHIRYLLFAESHFGGDGLTWGNWQPLQRKQPLSLHNIFFLKGRIFAWKNLISSGGI